jgi:heme exporter protein A
LFWDGRGIAEDMDLHHRRVIYLGHADGLKAGLTVGENLKFWHDLDGAPQAGQAPRGDAIKRDPDEVAAALDLFGLVPLADLPARFLSAGQRRRTTLARLALARARSAQLWLLDEPTTALDQQGQGLLLALIERHCAAAGQVMLASHDPLAGLQGRRLRIDDDRLVAA